MSELNQKLGEQYKLLGPAVYRRAKRLLGNTADAEEVLHEVFVRFAEHVEGFDRNELPLRWLYRETTNLCLDLLRSGQRRARVLETNYTPRTHVDWAPESALLLEQLMQRCKPIEAQAALYAYCDGMSHDEISQLLGVSRRTVSVLLDRVKARAERLEQSLEVVTATGKSS